jgi:sugar lactone lactonase YvrE
MYALMNTQKDSLSPQSIGLTPLPLHALGFVGSGLVRPECVLANAAGDLFTADWRGGVAHLRPDGRQALYAGPGPHGLALKPNGIALLRDGSFLLAHLGNDEGGVFRLQRSGQVAPWLLQADGVDLPPTNFVVEDAVSRFWVTVSTRLKPRALGYRRSCNDGFIVRVDARGAAIAADGLGYTNEVAVHPSGRWLYVNETFARRLSRFALRKDGSLGTKEVVTEFGAGTFPDGLAFDEEGHAWVVSIVSNRLIRVAPDGRPTVWLEDADAAHLAWVEAAFEAGTMGRPHLDGAPSRALRNISSIAFSGADRRTAVLGCLLGDRLATLRLPVAGVAPTHWHYA